MRLRALGLFFVLGTSFLVAAAQDLPRYDNTASGLQLMLTRMRSALAAGHKAEFESLLTATEIPNARDWYFSTYPADKAESWADPYVANIKSREGSLRAEFERIAQQEGEFHVRKLVDRPDGARDMEWGMLHAPKKSLDIYFASWRATGASRDESVGYFMYIESGFRWDSSVQIIVVPGKR